MEIQEVIRRWQARNSLRQIASGTGLSRDTVRKYVAAAQSEGIAQDGPTPGEEQLSRLAGVSHSGPRRSGTPGQDPLEPWADQIYRWLTGDRLQMTRIRELLAMRGCPVSYPSLRRFILKRNWRRPSKVTVRMEDTPPGEVAEADFGRLGMMTDPATGRRRAVWAMVIVLCHSRHCFLWPMQRQTLEDVIAGLESAWAFFGGIPKYLVIDNFPAAVVDTDPLHPHLTRGFLQYAQHRGFIADPARVRHPKDKPKVERGVPYARERFFKGGEFQDLGDVREQAQRWCLEVAGLRIHGTTHRKPLVVLPGRGARGSDSVGRRGLRDRRLARGQGASGSSHPMPPGPVLGALIPVSAGSEGGSQGGQQAGAHLPPRPADQDPLPPAQGRPCHRPRGLPRRALSLHHQGSRPHQGQGSRAGPGGGRVC